jgi:hypothetical protein
MELQGLLTEASQSWAICFASDTFGLKGFASISFQTIAWGRQNLTQTGFPEQ